MHCKVPAIRVWQRSRCAIFPATMPLYHHFGNLSAVNGTIPSASLRCSLLDFHFRYFQDCIVATPIVVLEWPDDKRGYRVHQ
mmetsp:Transcript_15439/g.44671  ORF Transcript_15439/g.44671 Transcript_15439/m.44671 type:complete len:82 (-) Transcript_15439:258-503(-)